MNEAFGIDFGTTNSAVVGRFRRNITNYGDADGQPFPSLVAVSKATGRVQAIGRAAWNRREELTESCRLLSSAKLYLGTNWSERIGPELWTAERTVAEILKAIRARVQERHAGALDTAVIAIPVGFSPAKRRALRASAKEAGITVRGFVSESTAAVFRNFIKVHQWPAVAVFDWGGGTLDISVVAIRDNTVEEMATASSPLAGDEIDRRLAEWAHMEILREKRCSGPPLSGMDARYRDLLISQCETAKRTLASEDIVEIAIARYGQLGTVNLVFEATEFVGVVRSAIEDAIATFEDCVVGRARLSFDQIGAIILVGGSSKLRGLREAMDAKGWSCEILSPPDSEWHVADGAAILAGQEGRYVCAQNVGIKLCDNSVYELVRNGQTVGPEAHKVSFGLVEDSDNARFVFVEPRDGARAYASANDPVLGYLSIPAYGFSDECIGIESQIDENLLLHVKAQSLCRGRSDAGEWTYPELRFRYRLPS